MAADRQLEDKAARLHGMCRLRQTQFSLPLLADDAMAVMLTLFIGSLQGRPLSAIEVAKANMISPQELLALTEQLIQAGLVATTGQEPAARSIGLTPIGSARMRSYIDVLPVV